MSNIGKNAETTIGGAKFKLENNNTGTIALTLETKQYEEYMNNSF